MFVDKLNSFTKKKLGNKKIDTEKLGQKKIK